MRFSITLEKDEKEFYVASCTVLPGCYSQGNTKAEAIDNIKQAIQGYIASLRKHREKVPVMEVEWVDVTV